MQNIFFGILTTLFCSIGYFYSWKFFKKENFKMAVALLIISGLGVLVYVSTDLYLHAWDERFHALVAKNLIQHPFTPSLYSDPILPYDYKNWQANHIWVHKQPLPLWAMASSMWLFGINEFALRLPSIILTSTGVWITFFIGSYFFTKRVGYIAAFLFSVNGLIIELTGGRVATDHIDIFFLFFIELAIFFSILFAQKRKTTFTILAGISIGAAILCKWLPALIVLPIWLLIVFDIGKLSLKRILAEFTILIAVLATIVIPWQVYIFNAFTAEAVWEASFNIKHLTEVLRPQSEPFYYFLDKIRMNYGELIYLPFLWFLWKTVQDIKNKKRLAICIWIIVPLLFFSFAKTKMQGYILFGAPALFLMTAEFFIVLSDYNKPRNLKWFYRLILVLLIALPIRYAFERAKPFVHRERKPEWVVELKELNNEKIEKGVLFNYKNPIEAMFYTNLTVYTNIPENIVIEDLVDKGYTILINDDGHIPDRIKDIEHTTTLKLSSAQ